MLYDCKGKKYIASLVKHNIINLILTRVYFFVDEGWGGPIKTSRSCINKQE